MNIEKIDKWLDNEYGVSYTRLEELHDFVTEQDLKHCEEKDKEIERLNNIINEAIKNIEWLRNTHHKTENIAYTKAVYNTNELLQISHILKGSDK